MRMLCRAGSIFAALCAALFFSTLATAADAPVPIVRTTEPIVVDGDLSDPAWQQATRFDTWFETHPGDNVSPSIHQTGWVTYDDRFCYVALKCDDPHPEQIRAPFGDHDGISGSSDDFAGIIIDSRNDSKTATEFFVTPHNTQFDASLDDNSGEDPSPDWFWDSATKITKDGWQLEIRIPFSSLRYKPSNVQTWGIILYRSYPRDRRVTLFTHRVPRDSSCLVCNFTKADLRELPAGQHWVAAPYVTGREETFPPAFPGAPLHYRRPASEQGIDVKWMPGAESAVDATFNPDFSQVESDVAGISANERFAIFYPEKRPFFLEDVSLFASPLQIASTRSITSPRWGLRDTGKIGDTAYTIMATSDRGGGLVIIPSPVSSTFALQDFASTAVIGRVRHDVGSTSFVSVMGTAREIAGGGHNRVFGPDFTWRPNDQYTITGQILVSDSRTPDRPDLAAEWDGRTLRSHAADFRFSRGDAKNDLFFEYIDIGDRFRADDGFLPQVGYRSAYLELGRTWQPSGFFSRVRLFGYGQYQTEQDSSELYHLASIGFDADGRHRSLWRIRMANEDVRTPTDHIFNRTQLIYTIQYGVSRFLTRVSLDGWVGQEVDLDHDRLGHGATTNLGATIRPSDHLEFKLTSGVRLLNVASGHLFTAQVERLRGTYTFDSRRFLRLVVQNERTNLNQALYAPAQVDHHSGDLATQLLFAYKLNWQTVMYIGAGDLRDVSADTGDFTRSVRSLFVKLSYAFQH